jgi:hypothetical protein
VHSIRVVWSENSSVPQECCDKEWFSGKKRVYYDKYETTSLNNRFVPPEGLSTDAVFAVDDDIRVPCSDLDFAYEVRACIVRWVAFFQCRCLWPCASTCASSLAGI